MRYAAATKVKRNAADGFFTQPSILNFFMDRLILFTRYPEPGRTKTRLIPALGPEGAADLHRRMTEQALKMARDLKNSFWMTIEIRYEGGNEAKMKDWLGADLLYQPQGDGDLGSRMARAFREAFEAGMHRVILVGTDCPGITGGLVRNAFTALQQHELVLGPAKDGGYYLIGLPHSVDQLFYEISWGSSKVLSKTLDTAGALNLRVFLLPVLADVDRPDDLSVWGKFIVENPKPEALPRVSIIIPTLNEEERIAACLASTQKSSNVERIVVDGGSQDRTVEIASLLGTKVLSSPKGRARQMNAGAEAATGELLIFLHADTCLPGGFDGYVRQVLARPEVAAGAFEFRLDVSSPSLRLIEKVANWRARKMQMPYGDQAIFIRADLFRALGGYPEMPIMEDFELIRRLKKKGRIEIASLAAITSARRWQTQGTWRTTFLHWVIVGAYYLGVSPSRIHRFARRNG